MPGASGRLAFLASLGPKLLQFDVDPQRLALTRRDAPVTLPADIQFACADSSGQCLYVISSNGGPGRAGDHHHASAFRIEWDPWRLRPLGEPVPLRHRPIHITTDRGSGHALIAFNDPSLVTVHRIDPDGAIGSEVPQPSSLDTGVFAHEICVLPSNRTAVLVTRGNDPSGGKPEEPGALKVFAYDSGRLRNQASVAPGGGYGFGPRNIAVGTTLQWAYAALERQNRLSVFRMEGDLIASDPSFECETLAEPRNLRPRQMVGTLRLHPNGRFVYVANRAFGVMSDRDGELFAGGENTIVVFELDERTGEPRLAQRIDTAGIYPRTFSIDPDGRMLVVANSRAMRVFDGTSMAMTPANFAVFAVGEDGRLSLARRYDVDAGGHHLFWSGLVTSPPCGSGG